MRKNIDIKDDLVADIAYLAAKEKRRGKTDTKNFIEDLVESYVIKKKETVQKKQGGSNNA
jgi:hypothetical protein